MHSKNKHFTSDHFFIFDSKESALALKQIVKNCFIPKHIYPEPAQNSTTHSDCSQMANSGPKTGPSFFKSCTNSPAKIKPGYIKKAAFVSRKVSQRSLLQAKRQIDRVKDQSTKIQTKMTFNVHPINIENVIEKTLTKRSTLRSTTTASSSRKLFKNSFVLD